MDLDLYNDATKVKTDLNEKDLEPKKENENIKITK